MGDSLGVVQHRRGRAVERRVGRQRLVDDLGPAPEAHEHVQAHRHEALGPVRHRRYLDAQQLLAERRGHLAGRLERRLDLAQEERAVDLEVVVVTAVERVEVERALALQVLAIGLDGPLVPRDDVAVAAAQHVDVRRHVLEVPGVGHEPAQLVGRGQRALRKRRHLHRVEVEVQQPGVRLRRARNAPLQHGERLARVGALGRLAGLHVPELPRSPADQRLRAEGRHVGIVAELAVGGPHRLGVGVAPERALLGRRRRREARRQRLDHRALDGGRAVEQGVRPLDGRARERDHLDQLVRLERDPVLVVVRAHRVGDAPVGHRTGRIRIDGALEAAHRLLVVEAVRPRQAPVEPGLRIGRGGRDRPAVAAEVVLVRGHHGRF